MPGTEAIDSGDVSQSRFGTDEPFFSGPSTKTGWTAVGFLGGALVAAVLAAIGNFDVMPGAGVFKSDWLPIWTMLVIGCAVVAGALGTLALFRKGERSWLVWVTIVPIALVTLYVLGRLVTSL